MKRYFFKLKYWYLKYFASKTRFLKYIYRDFDLFHKYELTHQQKNILKIFESKKDILICKGRCVGSTLATLYFLVKKIYEEKNYNICILSERLSNLDMMRKQFIRIFETNAKDNIKVSYNLDSITITSDEYVNKILFMTFGSYESGSLKGKNINLTYLPEFNSKLYNTKEDISYLINSLVHQNIYSNRLIIEISMYDDTFTKQESFIKVALNSTYDGAYYKSYDLTQRVNLIIKNENI
jgi:hypothetical protein